MFGKILEAKQKIEEVKQSLDAIKLIEVEMNGAVIINYRASKRIESIELGDDFYSKFSREEGAEMLTEAINTALLKAEERGKEEIQRVMKETIGDVPGLDMNSLMGGL